MEQINESNIELTNHLINDLNGVAEIGGLETSGDHGIEKLGVVDASIEIIALDFGR